MKKKIFLFLFSLCLFFVVYNYLFPAHRAINEEKAQFNIVASLLFTEFIEDSKVAEFKYLDQTISISGVITSLSSNDITVSNKIFCNFDSVLSKLKVNDSIVIKGRCIGYDELLQEIKLDQCSIVK